MEEFTITARPEKPKYLEEENSVCGIYLQILSNVTEMWTNNPTEIDKKLTVHF